MIIAGPDLRPDVKAAQLLQILFPDLPGRLPAVPVPLSKTVDIFPVDCRYARGIFRLFHPSFYFKGVDPGVHQLGQDGQDTHVLHGQGIIFLLPAVRHGRLSILIQDPVGEAAGPGASAPVAAAAAQESGEQAPAGIAIAHGAVDEGFDLDLLFPPQLLQFPQGQLPGRYDPADPHLFQETDGLRRCDRQLGAGVQQQAGTGFPEGVDHAQVLYYDAVQPGQIQPVDIGNQFRQFILPGQGINGQVDLSAENMGFPDGPNQLLLCEIVRVGPGAEFLSGQVESVGSCRQAAEKALPAAGGGQEFCFMHSHVLIRQRARTSRISDPGRGACHVKKTVTLRPRLYESQFLFFRPVLAGSAICS